jgi:hypothetical protein
MKLQKIFLSIVVGGMLVSVPMIVPAGAADDNSKYSDRDRMKSSKNEKDQLEQTLKTGEEKAFYRRELEKAGWSITSVNYDKPDYVEYEIVKGDQSYEVQIDIDKNSHKATKVDVATNVWKTDATKQALKNGKKVAYPSRTTSNPTQYSERDRMKSSKNQPGPPPCSGSSSSPRSSASTCGCSAGAAPMPCASPIWLCCAKWPATDLAFAATSHPPCSWSAWPRPCWPWLGRRWSWLSRATRRAS